MADIRISTLPRRASTAGVTILGYVAGGQPVGLDPAATYPSAAQIGAADADDVSLALAGKQDTAQRGLANGYAPLDGSGLVPASLLPPGSGDGPTLSDDTPWPLVMTAAPGTSTEVSRADHRHAIPTPADIGAAPVVHTHAVSAVTGLQNALNGKQEVTQRGIPNGYAPLDSTGRVPGANLPPGMSQSDLDAKASVVDLVTGLSTKADITYVDAGLSGRVSTSDTRIINAIQPGHLLPVETFSVSYTETSASINKMRRSIASASVNVTLPPMSIGSTIRYVQSGSGAISFLPGSGQSISSFENRTTTSGQNADVIATVISANVWHLSGVLS